MKLTTKLSLSLATLTMALAVSGTSAKAADSQPACTPVYGGGQICGSYTPVPTGADTDILYSLSLLLYTTGTTSFVLSKKANSLISLK